MSYFFKLLYICLFLVSGICVSQASGFAVGDIRIDHPWARSLPTVSKNGAVYLKLRNIGSNPDSLASASTPVADRVEFHTHLHENGMMMMRQLEKVDLPGDGEATLEPGGLHLMLFGINSPMTEGKEFPLTLGFEKAGEVEVTVRVGQP